MTIEELRLSVGQEIGLSDWLHVSQERIDKFAMATGDQQWIHTDPSRGPTIAHGFLTLSLLSVLAQQAIRIEGEFKYRINYGLNRVRFTAPVKAGARIRGRFLLQALSDFEGGIQVTYGVTIEIENEAKPALIAEWLVRLNYP